MSHKKEILKNFQTIPGVGKSIAGDLWNMGFRNINQLKNKNPDRLYSDICNLYGTHVDKCMLYVFRCAVYFASNKKHDSELLKWWNWKD